MTHRSIDADYFARSDLPLPIQRMVADTILLTLLPGAGD